MTTLQDCTEKKHRGNPKWGISKPYSEVRNYIKPLQFKTMDDYRQYVVLHKLEGFPLNPYACYTRKGEWISSRHFLGKTDKVAVKANEDESIKFRFSFQPIKAIIKQLMGR